MTDENIGLCRPGRASSSGGWTVVYWVIAISVVDLSCRDSLLTLALMPAVVYAAAVLICKKQWHRLFIALPGICLYALILWQSPAM